MSKGWDRTVYPDPFGTVPGTGRTSSGRQDPVRRGTFPGPNRGPVTCGWMGYRLISHGVCPGSWVTPPTVLPKTSGRMVASGSGTCFALGCFVGSDPRSHFGYRPWVPPRYRRRRRQVPSRLSLLSRPTPVRTPVPQSGHRGGRRGFPDSGCLVGQSTSPPRLYTPHPHRLTCVKVGTRTGSTERSGNGWEWSWNPETVTGEERRFRSNPGEVVLRKGRTEGPSSGAGPSRRSGHEMQGREV